MDRLTGRDGYDAYFLACFEEPCDGNGCDNPDCSMITNLVCERLAAYEDTGLAPDEIVALKAKLGEFSEAFKGAQAVCEVAISEKKQAIAERDRFKARAEAAEADIKRIADDMDGETDACYPCAICAKNNSRCDTSDNCFEWRGPQEGANT